MRKAPFLPQAMRGGSHRLSCPSYEATPFPTSFPYLAAWSCWVCCRYGGCQGRGWGRTRVVAAGPSPTVTTLACHLLPGLPLVCKKCRACHWKWSLRVGPGSGNRPAFGALVSAGSIQTSSFVHPTRSATQGFPHLGPGRRWSRWIGRAGLDL